MGIKTVLEINHEISLLRIQYENTQGTPCEVHTRIVGYYRSIRNWNPGKRQEYGERKMFKMPEVV